MLEVPLLPIPNQELQITLDNQDCLLHLYQRGDFLYLDLAIDDVEVRNGAICLPAMSIITQAYPFTGHLIFTDELSEPTKQKPPTYDGLGTRYFLYYMTDQEKAELDAMFEG